jgi:hypothetical protein
MNTTTRSLYDRDFYAWTQENARLIREGRLRDCDLDHIAEEIESMGARERRQLASRLEVLLMHLLKWQYQPALRGKSWQLTIKEQRRKMVDLLADNASLKTPENLDQAIRRAYEYAVIRAEIETGLLEESFPQTCPYSWAEIID